MLRSAGLPPELLRQLPQVAQTLDGAAAIPAGHGAVHKSEALAGAVRDRAKLVHVLRLEGKGLAGEENQICLLYRRPFQIHFRVARFALLRQGESMDEG